jgi:hypothetical protein
MGGCVGFQFGMQRRGIGFVASSEPLGNYPGDSIRLLVG